LDKEFLADYCVKQLEVQANFMGLVEKGDAEAAKEFYRGKIGRLERPLGRAASFLSLWPQIPFFGTIIVPLTPFAEPYFKQFHGFDPSEVGRLVDFAKDTNRITFVLNDDPKEFEGLDFLDPVFNEIKPVAEIGLPVSVIEDRKKDYDRYCKEFDTLSGISFYRYLSTVAAFSLNGQLGPASEGKLSMAKHLMHVYAELGVLGFDEILMAIRDQLVEAPIVAHSMLNLTEELLIGSATDPSGATRNLSREYLEKFQILANHPSLQGDNTAKALFGHAKEMQCSCDIGKFLMRKLTYYPDSFEACQLVCGLYDHRDLRKVLTSLEKAIKEGDYATFQSSANEFSKALDEVWADTSQVKNRANEIGLALTIGLGLVGTIASGPVGPVAGGLMAMLGYNVADRIVGWKTDSLSEKLARLITPNYLVNIYDFKGEHNLR
jgi:hypothetical protein